MPVERGAQHRVGKGRKAGLILRRVRPWHPAIIDIEQLRHADMPVGKPLLDQRADLLRALLGQRDIAAVARTLRAMCGAVEHRIGHPLQPFELHPCFDRPRGALAGRLAERRQPVAQRGDITVRRIGTGDDRLRSLAKLRYQRGYLGHAQPQPVDMGAHPAPAHDVGLDPTDQVARIAIQLAQLVADRRGRFPRLPRQPPDLVRHHGKALRRCATARRFDRGIDAEQSRLPRDRAQFVRHVADRFDHA